MLLTVPTRPNRLTSKKDEAYHLQYARWALGSYNVFQHRNFLNRYLTNVAFYKGDQWIFDEDLESFLMDESGSPRNRIRFVHNIVKPFVEYYRGAAVRMDMSAEVVSTSREALNRRDTALNEMVFYTKVAMKNPGAIADHLRSNYPIGQTVEETVQMFNNLWKDDYVEGMNNLLKYISQIRNDLKSFAPKIAEDLALGGIGILKEKDRNHEQVWKRISPDRFIWDMSSEEPDLRDAEYMGEFSLKSNVDILEEHQSLQQKTRLALENASQNTSLMGLHSMVTFNNAGYEMMNYAEKLPVYEMYWRDIELTRHGAFYDEYGYPALCEIDDDKFRVENLIPEKELLKFEDEYEWITTILKGRNSATIPTDQVRYCEFVPAEYVTGGEDIVLSYGRRKYSTRYSYQYDYLDFPYKVYIYSYIGGEVMSPIDSIISPQRFLNRTLSVAEAHVNNSRLSGTIIDKDTIDPQDGEEGITANMNTGKPIFLRGQRQINNAIGRYDSTLGQGALSLFEIAGRMKNIANEIIGSGDALTGQGGSYRATGAVANQNLSQGTIMQEPFFYGIERIYMQSYNSMVNRGKRIYASNKRRLVIPVGEGLSKIFEITKDQELEEYFCQIRRAPDYYDERDAANQLLFAFRQMGMLDDKLVAQYFNNATTNDVARAVREFVGIKYQAEATKNKVELENQPLTFAQERAKVSLDNVENQEYMQQQAALQADKNNAKMLEAAMDAHAKQSAQPQQ